MVYQAHYDSNGNILGFYIVGMHENIPKPTLELTTEQHQEYYEKGQCHIIKKQDDGTLAFVYIEPPEQKPVVITPPVNQDIADLYQAMFEMSAQIEVLKGGTN